MNGLKEVATVARARRKQLELTQTELASKTGVSRATIDAFENGRMGEIGFSKLSRILSALNLEFRLHDSDVRRPTLDELLKEKANDKSLE
jgi:transcriptional regulator with XRE-family HTH domain